MSLEESDYRIDQRPRSAICVRKCIKNCMFDPISSNRDITVVVVESIVLISVYLRTKNSDSSDRDIDYDLNHLRQVITKYENRKVIIMGDLNAHHKVWFNDANDKRGEKLLEFMIQNDLNCINSPNFGPTNIKSIQGRICSSHIDLTLINSNIDNSQIEWSLKKMQWLLNIAQ
jgi:hypothetical protein